MNDNNDDDDYDDDDDDDDGWLISYSHELLLDSWSAPWPSWHWLPLPSFIDLATLYLARQLVLSEKLSATDRPT